MQCPLRHAQRTKGLALLSVQDGGLGTWDKRT
jgi:hypothetical protein